MNEKMESSKFCLNWAEVLPLDHREALLTSLCTIIDEYLEDPESYPLLMVGYLPFRYRHRYDVLFKKRFLVSLVTVGYRLAELDPPGRLLACVAEELALHTVISLAGVLLECNSIEADFNVFTDLVFEDQDYLFLYRMDSDGIEDSDLGERMGIGPLTFETWFQPFEGAVVHPYAV